MTKWTVTPVRLGTVGLALIALVLTAPHEGFGSEARATVVNDAALSAHLLAVDAALARGDVIAATQALHTAYQAALGTRRWQGLIAFGDAAIRVGNASGARQPGIEQARRAYLLALFRARGEGSLDGALRAAQSFTALGDREVANGCLSVASKLARTDADRARVREMAARVNERALADGE
jgi:hypothetical protein